MGSQSCPNTATQIRSTRVGTYPRSSGTYASNKKKAGALAMARVKELKAVSIPTTTKVLKN